MNTRRRIVVAMSGGVDSSVAAALLASEGHEVIGITIKTYAYEDVGGNDGNESSCCSLDGINDARAVAAQFNFPHYVLDFSEPFNNAVIEDFVAEYMRGRTPNPCVVCNRKIKWEELIRKARALGADAIATGHYARVRRLPDTGRFVVSRGRDGSKDQSYALWGLTQESLSRTIFPLAEHTKPEVRALAEKLGLTIAGKGESFEICFIPDNNYERFLKERIPGLENKVAGGEIIQDGRVVGRHRGFPFYTIGQRRGIGVATGAPIYVTGIDPGNNRVTIGPEKALYHAGLIARNVNMMKYERCPPGLRVNVRIRYKDGGGLASAEQLPDGRLKIIFDEPRRAITPGQSAVLYEGDDLVGGGVIDDVLEDVPELA
jgi:tRNA-specific 2-thiouridylase